MAGGSGFRGIVRGGGGFRPGNFSGIGIGNFGGFRGSFAGIRGGFHRGFNFGSRAFYGFGFWPSSYPSFGWSMGYWPDYSYYPYYPSTYGNDYAYAPAYQPNVTVVYPEATQPAQTTVYVERAKPVIREYDEHGKEIAPAATPAGDASPIYLIAFKDGVIRAAAAYWVAGDTLHYVTLEHEEKQTPLGGVDRDFSLQLNRERRVPFRLTER
jgi:hypothetical protein